MGLFALLSYVHFVWAIPLMIVYSLVYTATRHEDIKPIVNHAVSFMFWLFSFFVVIYAILYFVT